MATEYSLKLHEFKSLVNNYVGSHVYPHTVEAFFESISDRSLFYTLEEVKKWFIRKRENSTLLVENIPLKEANGWFVDEKTGNISHVSGDFFTIHGIRVSSENREVLVTWDQPIVEQVGFDGGLLGIIRKRFNDIPHYLCEAKEEPGNYGKVQISPTLQATFANLNQSHGGRKPHFSDIFINRSEIAEISVLFDSWLAEDGGRLHLKRNRGILIDVPEDYEINIPNENFIWLSLYQIKELLKEDAWINPHVRGILAHV